MGQSLLFFEELDSTNTYLKQLPRDEISHGMLCITDNQTRGRGQYEKKWETQPGKNLTFTIALTPNENNRFHIITLAFARCITEELEELTGLDTCIKWPNDILVSGKKLAGILLDVAGESNGPCHVVIGIGMNYRMATTQAASIDQPWTDLAQLGLEAGRNEIGRAHV